MYQQALALDSDYLKARNNLGNTYMQLDMSFKAITELTKAILVDSESGLAYYNIACVYARTSEPEKAIRYLEWRSPASPRLGTGPKRIPTLQLCGLPRHFKNW